MNQQLKTRSGRLSALSDRELEDVFGVLSYGYYDERTLKLEIQREIQRRKRSA
jgi:hypothetical protein